MDEARAKRLKAALRDNLRRRKAQARGQTGEVGPKGREREEPPGGPNIASKPDDA